MSKTPLAAAAGEIKTRFGQQTTYRRLYGLILDGKLAAERDAGRYTVDIDEAARVLGFIERPA